eukprot:833547-Pelagomonas_calceolata.AAC.5
MSALVNDDQAKPTPPLSSLRTRAHTHTQTHAHTNVHTHTHTHPHPHPNPHTHPHPHPHTHTPTHPHTHTHTHTAAPLTSSISAASPGTDALGKVAVPEIKHTTSSGPHRERRVGLMVVGVLVNDGAVGVLPSGASGEALF